MNMINQRLATVEDILYYMDHPPSGSIPLLVSPELAEECLEFNTRPGQRKLNPNRVSLYANQIKNGEWHDNGNVVSFSTEGVLADGQTRLHAVIKAQINTMLQFRFGIRPEAIKTIDVGQARSSAQILKDAEFTDPGLLATAIHKLLVFGVMTIDGSYANTGSYKLAPTDLIRLAHEYKDEISKYRGQGKQLNKTFKHLSRCAHMCLLIRLSRERANKIDEFATDFKQSREGLMDKLYTAATELKTESGVLSERAALSLVVNAWDCYLKNKPGSKVALKKYRSKLFSTKGVTPYGT